MFNVTVNTVKFQDNPAIISTPKAAHSPYRSRQNNSFDGQKYDGALNYKSGYKLNVPGLRQRSIKAFEESTQARAAINRLVDSSINVGLSLQSTPVADLLSLSEEQVQEKSDIIEQRFPLWANNKNCDVSGNNTLGQIERINAMNQFVKGDYFCYLHMSDNPRLLNPLQVRIIPTEKVCTPYGTSYIEEAKRRGNEIVDGVEVNENGGADFYYFRSTGPGGRPQYVQLPRIGPISGRTVVTHGNKQRFGDEVRGVPILGHIAHELEKITDYSLLEIAAAISNATIASVVEPSENAPATNPLPSTGFVPPSLLGAYDDSPSIPDNVENGYTNIGKMVMRNAGGLMVASLNAGEKLKSFDTSRPNVNFEKFVDSMTKYLSASLNIPPEVLSMLFGQNYSASRAALVLFWQSLNTWRHEMVSDFLTPVYESWLLGEVATGKIILPGYDDLNMRAAWNSANWIGVPLPSIDPLKEERASEVRTKNGRTTNEHESLSRHNTSFRRNVRRMRRENELLAEARRPLETNTNGD